MNGKEEIKQAAQIIKNSHMHIDFVGFIEPHDLPNGKADVVVADGFAGNVLLKTVEGTVKFTTGLMKDAMTSNFISKIGALLCKKSISKVKNKLDYNKYGGSFFVGCKKTIIKSHGSSKDITICAAIEQAINLENKKVNQAITEKIEQLPALDFGEDNE